METTDKGLWQDALRLGAVWPTTWRGLGRIAVLPGGALLAVCAGHACADALVLDGAAGAAWRAGAAVAVLVALCVAALAALLPRPLGGRLTVATLLPLGGALLAVLAFPAPASARWSVFTTAATALGGLTLLALPGAVAMAALRGAVRGRLRAVWPVALLALVLLGATTAYVLASRRILVWDSMAYWTMTEDVAAFVRQDAIGALIRRVVLSAGDEYSLIPAVATGVVTAPLHRYELLGYMLAVATFYVVPAIVAVGALGLALAERAVPTIAARRGQRVGLAVLGGVCAIALLPHFLQVFLRFVMLDSGGVVLVVLLAVAWDRLLRLLLAPRAAAEAPRHAVRLLALAVAVGALSLFAFTFRRWYVFDVVGLAAAAALWLGGAGVAGRWPRGRALLADLGIAAAGAMLAVLALAPTVIARWVADWGHRQYGESYAAYRASWAMIGNRFEAFFGMVVPALLMAVALVLLLRGPRRRLLFLLLTGTVLAALGFVQVQGFGPQHLYLLLPLLGGVAACGAILAALRIGSVPVLLAAVAAFAFLGLAPRHWGPLAAVQPVSVVLWPERDPAVPELVRLGHWLAGELRPGERYCIAASGPRLNWSAIANVWQADRSLLGGAVQSAVLPMPEVDSRDGPQGVSLRACAVMVVASPAQFHLRPEDQQDILMLREDVLGGTGVGRAFVRLDARFDLPDGVTLTAYRQARPITDAELRDLRARFYAGKGAAAARYAERFGPP